MSGERIALAQEAGIDGLDAAGRIAVFGPRAGADLSALPQGAVEVVQTFRPDHDHFAAAGYACTIEAGGDYDAALVCLPRAKALARRNVARAVRAVGTGPVLVDGQKTDGIDSVMRDLRRRVTLGGAISKAHGRILWFHATPDVANALGDWLGDDAPQQVEGFRTAPGVFSADGIDPASRLLAETLPARPGRHLVDLGAGWGYLAARALDGRDGIATLDLVEADAVALDCARANVTDGRARFHWADASRWTPGAPVDCVLTNPPFHTGRAGDPELGRAFIAAAARMLTPHGSLWLVANRHLPYEAALSEAFTRVEETGGDGRFKIFHASGRRGRR